MSPLLIKLIKSIILVHIPVKLNHRFRSKLSHLFRSKVNHL